MKHLRLNRILLFVLFGALIYSCTDDTGDITTDITLTKDFTAEVPLAWYGLFLEIDRYSPGYRPPAASRMLGYVGLAGYEAAVPGMPDYNSLELEFPGLSIPSVESGAEYHWPTCVNAAYAASLKYFYPHIKATDSYKIIGLEEQFNTRFTTELAPDVFSRSKAFGYEVAEAVYNYSKTDIAGHEAFTNPRPSSYVPPAIGLNGEKLWQPTFPDYTPALFPYWGNVRPFAMTQSDLIARPPLPYSENPNSKFYQQANETRLWVNNANYEDKWIAEFWSDDFFEVTFEPAGRQIAIANILVEDEDLRLDQAVELYAKMGMAMCDAAIAIWNSKYIYNVIRPIQFIRTVMEPGWTTLLNHPVTGMKSMTPEFPAYPSGHSGFGSSASAIMAEIFGNTRPFTDNCHQNRTEFNGTPRSYNTILEAGVENAYSRLPLGVHFRMDCDEGVRLGYLAALRVQEMPWYK
ncbi:MAG TPA: vanadium-dependent haloperoxidase [Saprospiraceae bacterium]|nr:vanadium-dependent haloperoxidase [Saprospiraceae bacterium]